MKVNRVTLWSVDLTSHETYYMAEGKTCPIPNYLPAFADGVPSAIAEMAPEILGVEPFGVDALMRKLERFLQGHLYLNWIETCKN